MKTVHQVINDFFLITKTKAHYNETIFHCCWPRCYEKVEIKVRLFFFFERICNNFDLLWPSIQVFDSWYSGFKISVDKSYSSFQCIIRFRDQFAMTNLSNIRHLANSVVSTKVGSYTVSSLLEQTFSLVILLLRISIHSFVRSFISFT